MTDENGDVKTMFKYLILYCRDGSFWIFDTKSLEWMYVQWIVIFCHGLEYMGVVNCRYSVYIALCFLLLKMCSDIFYGPVQLKGESAKAENYY